ncbi:hypothetical protein CRE_06539 [Caenorhabditis remanei]|uniref:Uncharacterized protein n=1 Tax=Caenorhabditis remanei TaxID=31234 RepID=E3M1G3_CAERE|nr:hypothetical protein CRE_06539 [Caenorhabditis remanei]
MFTIETLMNEGNTQADQPSTSTAPPPVPFNYSPPALTAPLLKALLTKAASNGPSSNGHPLPGAAQNRGPSSSSSSSSSSPSHSVGPISTQTPSPPRFRPSPSVQTPVIISGPATGKYAHPHDGSGSSTPSCSASTSAPTQADLSLVRKFMRKTSRVQPLQNGVNHVAPRVTPPARPIQVIDIDAPGPSAVRAPAQNSIPSTSNGGTTVSNDISSVVAVLSKLPSAKLSSIRPTPTASSVSIEEAKLFKLFMNTVFGLLKSKTFLSNSLEIQMNLCDILMVRHYYYLKKNIFCFFQKFDRLSDDGREMVRPHLCSELCQLIFSLTLLVRDLKADLSRRPSPSASTSIAVQTDPEIIVTETTEPLDLTVSRTSPSDQDQQEDQEFHAEKSVDQEIDRMWADLEAQIRSKYKRKLVDVHDCYIDEVEKKGVVVGHLIEKRNFKRKRTMSEPSNFSTKKQRRD